MIILDRVSKVIRRGGKTHEMFSDISEMIPTNRRIAVLGPNPREKRVFVNMLAGVELPTSGNILRKARVSFPVGHMGGFANDMSVRLNVSHVARLYGSDVHAVVDFVEQVMKLGPAFDRPYGALAARERFEFCQVLAYSIPFDVYVLGEEASKPNARNKMEVKSLFEARARTSGMILATQDEAFAREFCDMGIIVNRGRVRVIKGIERALAAAAEIPNERGARRNGGGKRRRESNSSEDET